MLLRIEWRAVSIELERIANAGTYVRLGAREWWFGKRR